MLSEKQISNISFCMYIQGINKKSEVSEKYSTCFIKGENIFRRFKKLIFFAENVSKTVQKYIVKGPEEKFEVVPKIQLLSAEDVTHRAAWHLNASQVAG